MYITFKPLVPGEIPGDPELGGWRPLPKSLFGKPAYLTVPSITMDLEQAVAIVGFIVQYLNLGIALGILATELAPSPHSLREGGVQFS